MDHNVEVGQIWQSNHSGDYIKILELYRDFFDGDIYAKFEYIVENYDFRVKVSDLIENATLQETI